MCEEFCQDVKIKLVVDYGDPELYGLVDSEPAINGGADGGGSCKECQGFCYSRGGATESCNISTKENKFYIAVHAYQTYGSGNITFENVGGVVPYGNERMKYCSLRKICWSTFLYIIKPP